MTNTPNTTKPADKPEDGEGTKLAQVQNPAKLTDAKIKDISGDDGSDEAENSANKDVAEKLKEDRKEAKAKKPVRDDDGETGYFAGQGGAQGI